MMLSVLTYALCSGMCGFAASAWQGGILRFLAALGMGGEWALGVALINEIWPGRSRAFLAGLVGAAGNVGYLLIALIGLGVLNQIQSLRSIFEAIFPQEFADTLLRGQAWRLMMIVGALPSLLTCFIRAFVPESARWERENRKGNTSHWLSRDLLGVLLGSLGACALIWLWAPKGAEWEMHLGLKIFASGPCVFIVASGYTYPVIRFLQRLHATDPTQPAWRPMLRRMLRAGCLTGVALIGTWGSVQQAPTYAIRVAEAAGDGQLAYPKETTQISTALGAIIATILAALMGDWLGRRITYCLMCVGSLVIIPLFYQIPNSVNYEFLAFAFFSAGITAAFYGWLPLYLPELFRTSMRATGQGFGFNFGRVLAAIGVLQLGSLTEFATRSESTARLGGLPAVCSTLSVVYIAGRSEEHTSELQSRFGISYAAS